MVGKKTNKPIRRSQRQIIRLMLENAKEGIKKTPLMFASHVSFKQLEPYLKILVGMGLLGKEGPYYRTTAKGLRWLGAFRALRLLEEPREATAEGKGRR